MPPAYWDLIVYELAISLAPSFNKQPDQILLAGRQAALKAVQVNNITFSQTQKRLAYRVRWKWRSA